MRRGASEEKTVARNVPTGGRLRVICVHSFFFSILRINIYVRLHQVVNVRKIFNGDVFPLNVYQLAFTVLMFRNCLSENPIEIFFF